MALGRKLVLAFIGALLGAVPLSAQNSTGTVTGRVVDAATQEPLSGAAVTVAERRSVTTPDGRFTITGVPLGTQTVRITRIGYGEVTRTVTVTAGAPATVEVTLSSQALSLEGVVAIGYGEVRERDRTGVVEAVTAEEFNPGRVVSAEQLIQGKVAGVQVVDSGEPGGGISLRIRGGTSVTAGNEPLYVLDGVPLWGQGVSVGRNPLNFLNPNDIESINILKDAAATAIYGSRGANGVIIIKTKQGRQGGPQLSYTTTLSTSQVAGEPDLLNAAQFRSAVEEFAPENMGKLGNASTNWRGAVQRDAMGQEHAVAVAGSGESMNYRLSLGYLDQEGVVRGTALERLSAALSYNQRLFDDRLSLQANLRGSRIEDEFTPGGVVGAATAFAPTQPITGNFAGYYEWADPLGPNNPVAELALVSDAGTTYRSVGGLEGQYRMPFLEALSATVRVGYDMVEGERTTFSPSTLKAQQEGALGGTFNRQSPNQLNTVLDAYATLDQPLERLDGQIDLTAGYSYEQSRREFPSFFAQGLSSDLLGPDGIPAATKQQSFLDVQESKLVSGFARANFSLKDRYLMTLSVRRDGSSRFGPDNQWGTFPSAALAWRVSEESFMEGIDFLSDLKLRASWGINGNQEFADYLWIVSYQSGLDDARVQFGDEFVPTIRPIAVDPNIKWEETTSYNLGLDYGFLDGRITGAFEYYFKDTEDLLFRVPVAAGTNLSNFVTTNIGSVENRGFEASIEAILFDGGDDGFTWEAGFNASTNRNRLTQINSVGGNTQTIRVGGIAGGVGNNIQILRPGQPINTFYVYQHRRGEDGRPVVSDDATEMYVDQNGDDVINENDLRPFHSPAPQWTFGATSQLGWRRFDAGFTLRGAVGNYVYNNVASNLGHYGAVRGAAPTNLHASVLENGFTNPQYFSDLYVEDASFLRMDNVTLGYTFNDFRGVDRMRVFGTVQNAFTITGYSGVDPTAGLNGIDNNLYPRSRTFSLGVDLGF